MQPEPKSPFVPWTAFDVALWLAIGFVTSLLIFGIVVVANFVDQPQHDMASGIAPIMLLLSFLALVVITPLVEEFLFRMLFQGWLEAKLTRFKIPGARGFAIVTVSLCFAALHPGVSSGSCLSTLALFSFFVAIIILYLPIFIFGLIYLARVRGVRISNYLFGTEPFFRPGFFAGAGYCLLALLFYIGLFAILTLLCGGTHVKPFAIFFFSLALGTLYSKTQNLSYCVLLHACLNIIGWAALALVFTFGRVK